MTYVTNSHPVTRVCSDRPTLGQMLAIWKQRRQLRTMDEHTLADIGLTRQEALTESRRPMWDGAGHCLR